jgi:hypothetical protein
MTSAGQMHATIMGYVIRFTSVQPWSCFASVRSISTISGLSLLAGAAILVVLELIKPHWRRGFRS